MAVVHFINKNKQTIGPAHDKFYEQWFSQSNVLKKAKSVTTIDNTSFKVSTVT